MPYGREGSWSQCAPVTEEETSQSAKRVSAESPAHGDAPVVALFSGVTPGIMAVPAGGGSALVKGSPAVSQLPYTSLSAFCAPACSSSATPTHDVEVRNKTEGLEEGAAAQRVDGGVGLDVLATQGWKSVCQSAPRRWVR